MNKPVSNSAAVLGDFTQNKDSFLFESSEDVIKSLRNLGYSTLNTDQGANIDDIFQRAGIFVVLPGGTETLSNLLYIIIKNRYAADRKRPIFFIEKEWRVCMYDFIERNLLIQDDIDTFVFVEEINEISIKIPQWS